MVNLVRWISIIIILVIAGIGWFALSDSTSRGITSDLSASDLSDESKMLYSFITREGKRLGEKYNMSLCSIGGGTDKGIWLMSFDFQRYGSLLTEKDARELIIKCLNDYLKVVNRDEKLRPFLKEYPFEAKNIEMGIFNYEVDKKDVYHPYIRVVASDEGKISYYTKEKENEFRYKSRKYESYEEAVAILKNEKK